MYPNTYFWVDLHVDLQPFWPHTCALLKPDMWGKKFHNEMLTFHKNVIIFSNQVTFQKLNLVYLEITVTFRAFDTSLLFCNCI